MGVTNHILTGMILQVVCQGIFANFEGALCWAQVIRHLKLNKITLLKNPWKKIRPNFRQLLDIFGSNWYTIVSRACESYTINDPSYYVAFEFYTPQN